MSEENKMVIIANTSTDYEARILGGILEEEGISVQLSGEHTSSFRTEAPGLVSLQVLQKDAERAREILLKARQDAGDMDWDKVDLGTSL